MTSGGISYIQWLFCIVYILLMFSLPAGMTRKACSSDAMRMHPLDIRKHGVGRRFEALGDRSGWVAMACRT